MTLVNIGIMGLKSEEIDWEKLEVWLKTLLEREGVCYNVTQALSAMLLAGKPCAVAPALEYLLMPDREQTLHPQAVLHHYVEKSRPCYFRYGWRHVLHRDRQLEASRCSV
jgi:hypothetical protein